MTNTELLILIASIVVVIIIIATIFFFIFRKKKVTKIESVLNPVLLIDALGGRENITKISLEQRRLKILLFNPKLVSQGLLKTLEISAFLTGKEIKLLIKSNPLEVKKQLDKLIGEK